MGNSGMLHHLVLYDSYPCLHLFFFPATLILCLLRGEGQTKVPQSQLLTSPSCLVMFQAVSFSRSVKVSKLLVRFPLFSSLGPHHRCFKQQESDQVPPQPLD